MGDLLRFKDEGNLSNDYQCTCNRYPVIQDGGKCEHCRKLEKEVIKELNNINDECTPFPRRETVSKPRKTIKDIDFTNVRNIKPKISTREADKRFKKLRLNDWIGVPILELESNKDKISESIRKFLWRE